MPMIHPGYPMYLHSSLPNNLVPARSSCRCATAAASLPLTESPPHSALFRSPCLTLATSTHNPGTMGQRNKPGHGLALLLYVHDIFALALIPSLELCAP